MKLNKNKILITGATEGIGNALTMKFLSLDNKIIAVGRNQEKLQQLARADKRISPFECDLSKMQELERLSLFVEQEHRDLNILVNNAGIQYNYQFTEEPNLLDKIEQEVNVNFLAPLRLIAMLLPTIKQNENPAIINVTSGLGIVPKKQGPVYCGTKAGLHIFSKALRYQLDGVKVFEIIPPLVDTGMTSGRGRRKISPQQLANEFIRLFAKDNYEMNIGKVKLLKLVNRISPALAAMIMKKG